MNIFDLIFEAKKEDPYTKFDDFKAEQSKQKKKQNTFDQSKMPKGERDWEVEQIEQKEKNRKEREQRWHETAEISKINAVSDLKKNISTKGAKLRGNADGVDQDFHGKSLREIADSKKENADGKAVIFSKKELENIIMSEDKAFIDAVSILSDLNLLHSVYHVAHSGERPSFTKEYIEWFLDMLGKGNSPETAIINLSTTKKADATLKRLNREYEDAHNGFMDALEKANRLDGKKTAEINAVKEKTQREIASLGGSIEDGTEKPNFDFEKDFSSKDPKYKEAFNKQIDKAQASVKEYIKTKTEQLLYTQSKLIKDIEEKYEKEEKRLKDLRSKFIEDEKRIEKEKEEYKKEQQYDYYEVGPKYKELSQLLIKYDTEKDAKKKAEFKKRIDELSKKYKEDFDNSLSAFGKREKEEEELYAKNRELTDQIEKALSSGQTIKAQDLKAQKDKIVKQINKLKDAKEENGIYYKFTREGDNKSLYTIQTFKYKNVGAFLSELRNSIFLMNKDLMTTLTRIVNLLYFGRDEKGEDEDTSERISSEELQKRKKQAEAERRYHKNEIEIGFDEHTKAIRKLRKNKLNELKPLMKKMLELQRATGKTLKEIIKSIDASIEEKKGIFSGLKQGDFGIFADDYDKNAEEEITKKTEINVDKLKKELQAEFDKLVMSDREYDDNSNKRKIDRLLNKAQVQRELSDEEIKYNEAKTELEKVNSVLDNLKLIQKKAEEIFDNFDDFAKEENNRQSALKLKKFIKKYRTTLIKAQAEDYITLLPDQEKKNRKILSELGFINQKLRDKNKIDLSDFEDVFDEISDFSLDLQKDIVEIYNKKEEEFKKLPVPKKSGKTRKEMMSDVIENLSKRSKLSEKIKKAQADIAKTRFWNNPSYEEIRRKIAKEMGKE